MFSVNQMITVGYRDQYPEFPDVVGLSGINTLFDVKPEIDDYLDTPDNDLPNMSRQWLAALEGRRAGRDLDARDELPTTELIDRWMTPGSGHINYPGYIFGKHSIVKVESTSVTVACRFDGRLYYLWGSLPGHRFPSDATAYTFGTIWNGRFPSVVDSFKKIREYMASSHQNKKRAFRSFIDRVRKLPEDCSPRRVWEQHGEVGMLRYVFGKRWGCAIVNPDMQTGQAFKHEYIKNDKNYVLLSMEDAVQYKLTHERNGAIISLIDLRAEMEII